MIVRLNLIVIYRYFSQEHRQPGPIFEISTKMHFRKLDQTFQLSTKILLNFLFFKKIKVLLEQNLFMKSTEHYVESILKIIYKDRMKNESRISDWRFLTWSLFRPDGLKLVNCKISLWSFTRKLVQVVGAPDWYLQMSFISDSYFL